ncbi:hypothetical protein [Haloarcula litorea]|uniref:hypothetical protein n=1 Tax=Haloarcula litorea TaxID=3032579 RepID=UPI0023E89DA6|nr:hypothetical protein [Halomicroarcula sp. GDY20]
MGTKAKMRFADDDGEELVWRQLDGYPRIVLNHVHDIIERLESRTGNSPHPPGLAGLLVAVGARSPHCPYRDYEDEIEAAFASSYEIMTEEEYEARLASFAYDFRCDDEREWSVRVGVMKTNVDDLEFDWTDEVPVDEAVDRWGDITDWRNADELLGIE